MSEEGIGQAFVDQSRRLLTGSLLPKIERAVATLGDEDVWWRPNEASNSVGNLLLHLTGNVSQWLLAGVGGRTYERHRQAEFDAREGTPGRELAARLAAAVREADEVLAGLDRQRSCPAAASRATTSASSTRSTTWSSTSACTRDRSSSSPRRARAATWPSGGPPSPVGPPHDLRVR